MSYSSYPRINAKDSFAWGKLVKTWATGKNYVDHVATEQEPVPVHVEVPPTYPKPTSFEEFAEQAIRARAGLYFEDDKETPVAGDEDIGFALLQATYDMFVLRLPPKDLLEYSEENILATPGYELPGFYDRIYGTTVQQGQVATKIQRAQLHAERIGEYTMNSCH
jgi:hypothetical protein